MTKWVVGADGSTKRPVAVVGRPFPPVPPQPPQPLGPIVDSGYYSSDLHLHRSPGDSAHDGRDLRLLTPSKLSRKLLAAVGGPSACLPRLAHYEHNERFGGNEARGLRVSLRRARRECF